MTDPNTPAGTPVELTDLTPDAQELSAEDAQNVRGGLLSAISKLDGDGKTVKITDGTSNTLSFSWGMNQT